METVGNYSWMVDEVKAAGCTPHLVHAHKAKLMLGRVNKTDRLDAKGLVQLQRTGTLPVVWIPPQDVRDMRELPRARMVYWVWTKGEPYREPDSSRGAEARTRS
jgi:transposase